MTATAATAVPAAAQAATYPGPAGPRDVHGAIEQEWLHLGGAGGALGRPTTSEIDLSAPRGAFNHFERGSVYWSPSTGAHAVRGAIQNTWAALGWERSVLGYPTSDELTTADGAGRDNRFQHGAIYWSPSTGAHAVVGAIAARWLSLGAATSPLGYPVSEEYAVAGGGRESDFQHGAIIWSPAGGAVVVPSAASGSGNDVVHLTAPQVPMALHVVATGTGDVTVTPLDAKGQQSDFDVEATGPYDGTTPLDFDDAGPTAALEVAATGPWTVQLVPLSHLPALHRGQSASGSGTTMYHYVGAAADARVTYTGTGVFEVDTFDDRTGAYSRTPAMNEEGSGYTGTVELTGHSFVAVESDAPWTISVH